MVQLSPGACVQNSYCGLAHPDVPPVRLTVPPASAEPGGAPEIVALVQAAYVHEVLANAS